MELICIANVQNKSSGKPLLIYTDKTNTSFFFYTQISKSLGYYRGFRGHIG